MPANSRCDSGSTHTVDEKTQLIPLKHLREEKLQVPRCKSSADPATTVKTNSIPYFERATVDGYIVSVDVPGTWPCVRGCLNLILADY